MNIRKSEDSGSLAGLLLIGIVLLTAPPASAGDEIFSESFECGCTALWTNELEEGPDLSIVTVTGLEGTFAARFAMTGTSSLRGSYLVSSHPLAESQYRARFLARWPGLSLQAGSHVALLRGYASEGGSSGPTGKMFELRLHQPVAGAPQLRLAASDTTAEAQLSRPVCLDASTVHDLEVRWRSPGVDDRGSLHLLVDGTVAATLASDLLSETTLELVHFGTSYCRGTTIATCIELLLPPNPFAGATGSIDLDAFASFASFANTPDPIFTHDFECGDLAGWSASAP